MLIGITGKAGSGKSLIADCLIMKHSYRKLSFATKVKEAAQLIYNLSWEQLYGNQKDILDKRLGITPRFIYQQLGTEIARLIHPDTWIMALEALIKLPSEINYVIDDCRFLNEAEWIKSKDGIIIYIKRDNIIKGLDSSHQSETEIDKLPIDIYVNNYGTKEELFNMIDVFIKEQII